MPVIEPSLSPGVLSALERARELPCLPAVALQVLRISSDEHAGARELGSIVALDPALSAKLLQTANSALFGGIEQITTTQMACARLGFKMVKLTALSVALLETVSPRRAPGFDHADHGKRCLVHAVAAKLFADKVQPSLADEAFMGGLLARIGQLLVATSLKAEFEQLAAMSP